MVREKNARLISIPGDLPDAQRFHHGPSFKNRDDFGNMRTVLD
jgi:hypothetical protein